MPQEPSVNLFALISYAVDALGIFVNLIWVFLAFFFLISAQYIWLPIANREVERTLVHILGFLFGILFTALYLILAGALSAAGAGGKIFAILLWIGTSAAMAFYILSGKGYRE